MRSFRETLVTAQSTAANFNSPAMLTQQLLCMSIIAIQTGTSTGTLKVQGCNDDPNVAGNPSQWADIPTQSLSISAAGNTMIPKFELSHQWVRVVYTATNAAAGTVTVLVKGLSL